MIPESKAFALNIIILKNHMKSTQNGSRMAAVFII